MTYSHSYEDPDTGDVVDVYDDDDGAEDYRNARPRHRRGRGFSGFAERARPRRPFPHQHGGGIVRPAPRPRDPAGPMVVRPREPRPTRPAPAQGVIQDGGEFYTIKKSVIAELLPAAGQVWASLLAPPEPPQAIGNDIVDRDNAAMHRQALAMHDQNQTRILALTNLASRVAKLFL